MTGVRKVEHAKLYVEDVARAVDFYTGVLGLVEVARRGGAVYLGCGLDAGYDLAVAEGGTGVEHVAVRVSAAEYDGLRDRAAEAGVETTELAEAEPGEERALRVTLPSGVSLEFVDVADASYPHPASPATGGARRSVVRDLDHVNLASPDVERDATFLRDVFGFALSDVRHRDGEWIQAFTRRGDYHHDVAFTRTTNADATLHHLAWELPSVDAIKTLADDLASVGVGLEMGAIGRHQAGGCIFAYVLEPGGNRFEICTEMPTLDADTETGFHDADAESSSVSAWGELAVPDSFSRGT